MEFLFSFSARKKLLEGIAKVVDPVKNYFGTGELSPFYELKEEQDPLVALGTLFARKTFEAQEKSCFDGRKLSLLFFQALVQEGVLYLGKGYSPFLLKKELFQAQNLLFSFLEKRATFFSDLSWIKEGFFFEKEESSFLRILSSDSKREKVCFIYTEKEPFYLEATGLLFPFGFGNSLFASRKESLDLKNPLCFVINQFTDLKKLFFFWENIGLDPFLLIAQEVSKEFLSTLLFPVLEKKKKGCLILAKKENLSLLAKDLLLRSKGDFFLGKLERALIFQDKSLFFLPRNLKKTKVHAFFCNDAPEKEVFFSLLQKTLKEGFIEGGACGLMRASFFLEKELSSPGSTLLQKAFKDPFYHLVRNHARDPEKLLPELKTRNSPHGFDRKTGKIENLYEKKVFDSIYLIKKALSIALEKALEIFFTEGVIS